MRYLFASVLFISLLAPWSAYAANAQAQEYDDLGLALYRQGLYAKSIPYFQNAVQADPTDWQGYEDLGNAYFKINANQDALTAYQKSLQINPDNTTLENIIQTLQANATPVTTDSGMTQSNPAPAASSPAPAYGNSAPNAPTSAPPTGSVESEQPIQNNPQAQSQPVPPQQPSEVIVTHRRGWRRANPEPEVVYQDNLAPINHSKFWATVELGYNWSNQADLMNGATNFNNFVNQGGYTGIATMDNSGVEGGVELGFMLDENNGIALGFRGIATTAYNANINYQNGNSQTASDFETVSIQPYVVPLTLDYYLFLPDHDGRFFLTAGVGYYFADVTVNDNFSYTNQGGGSDQYLGDLTGGNIGFQFGVGRDFELSRHLGLRLFARGRYAKITNINGTFTSADGDYDNYGLVTTPQGIYVDSTSNIGGNEKYATLDYTGFDVGIGLTFF